eukprot:CAMPEP_0184187302 /NCGR_PEP_ID=MMETSP0976-20121227/861_1 /TAXON_ID=483370 /ORGANISM="non described non described, Strain CCMP2097" /LENGTH=337 /DNA_ID=CAMNT_0026491605 /DNA_START=296 /DNA_END=1307 /DNA_ORIENTATION=+
MARQSKRFRADSDGRWCFGPSERGPLERGPSERGPLEIEPLEIEPLEREPLERGPLERGPLEREPLERGPLEIGPLERGPLVLTPTSLLSAIPREGPSRGPALCGCLTCRVMLERDRATILGTAPFQRLFSATWCPEAVPCCRSMSGSLAPSGPPASACPVRDQTPQFSRLAPGGDPCLFLNGPYFKRRKVHKGPLSWPVSRDRDQHLAIAGSTAIAQKQKAQLQNPHQGGNLRMEQHAKRCGDANTLEMHLSTAVARHAFNFGFGLFGSWVVGLLESRFFRRGWFDARVSTAFKGRRTLPEKKARRVTNMPGRWKKTNGRASDNGAKAVLKTGQSP